MHITCDVSGPGRLPSGVTEIPFEIPIKSKPNRVLYETYHGVYVNISYGLKCDIRRSFLSKDLQKQQQFLIQYKPKSAVTPQTQLSQTQHKSISFEINPALLSSGGSGTFFKLNEEGLLQCDIYDLIFFKIVVDLSNTTCIKF